MDIRKIRPYPPWLLLFLALVLGTVAMLMLVLRKGSAESRILHDVAIGIALLLLVLSALAQWLQIRQLVRIHDRALSAESRAQQAQTQLHAALDILPDAIALFDAKDKLVLCNNRYREMYPMTAHLMVPGTSYEDIIRHSARAGAIAEAIGREEQWVQHRLAQHRGNHSESLQEMFGDQWVRLSERRTPDGGIVSLRTNVTDFIHNERALHAARQQAQLAQLQLHEALEAMPAGLEIYDEQDRLIVYNEHLAHMMPHLPVREALGKTYEQLVWMGLAQGIPPIEPDRQAEWVAELLAQRGQHTQAQLRDYPDGRWLHLHETRTASGYTIGVRLDITELVRQRQELDASRAEAQMARELLEDAIETLPEAFALYDKDDRLVACNSQFRKVYPLMTPLMRTGQSFEEMLRHGVMAGQFPEAQGQEDRWIAERMHEHHAAGTATLQQLPDQRWLRVHERRTRSGGIAGVRTDVTELVHKEQQLAAANAQLAQLSTTDALTGIGNRRHFDERLSNEWNRGARQQIPLALLLVDIDHFKLYNDHYGHVAGDHCLRTVAHALAGCVRRADEMAARYGGEEFVLLLPGTCLDAAREVAQLCLDSIEALALPHASSCTASVITISIGVASMLPVAGADPRILVDAADAALYLAKKEGRNQFGLQPAASA